jgi:thioredoxin 1
LPPWSPHEHKHTSDAGFEQDVLKSDLPVLVDYWAEWCGPCKMIAPILDEVSRDYNGRVLIAKLNVDENQATAARYGVRGIPTLMLFRNGAMIGRRVIQIAADAVSGQPSLIRSTLFGARRLRRCRTIKSSPTGSPLVAGRILENRI